MDQKQIDALLTTIAREGRQLDGLLKRFATRPVPNYMGFMAAAAVDGGLLGLQPPTIVAVVAEARKVRTTLIAKDEERGDASEEGLQAFLEYKLLVRLCEGLPPRLRETIEQFERFGPNSNKSDSEK